MAFFDPEDIVEEPEAKGSFFDESDVVPPKDLGEDPAFDPVEHFRQTGDIATAREALAHRYKNPEGVLKKTGKFLGGVGSEIGATARDVYKAGGTYFGGEGVGSAHSGLGKLVQGVARGVGNIGVIAADSFHIGPFGNIEQKEQSPEGKAASLENAAIVQTGAAMGIHEAKNARQFFRNLFGTDKADKNLSPAEIEEVIRSEAALRDVSERIGSGEVIEGLPLGFSGPEGSETIKEGKVINPEDVATGASVVDPQNIALMQAGNLPGVKQAAGLALKGSGVLAEGAGSLVKMGAKAGSKVSGRAIPLTTLLAAGTGNLTPLGSAVAGRIGSKVAGWSGSALSGAGRVAREAGEELLDPSFVSGAATRAAKEAAGQTSTSIPGKALENFGAPMANIASAEKLARRGAQGAAIGSVGAVPTLPLSESPEAAGAGLVTGAAMGAMGMATDADSRSLNRAPEINKAATRLLAQEGAKIKFRDQTLQPLHEKGSKDVPQSQLEYLNALRGLVSSFTKGGKNMDMAVLDTDDYVAEYEKRFGLPDDSGDPSVKPLDDDDTGQGYKPRSEEDKRAAIAGSRGFYDPRTGAIILNKGHGLIAAPHEAGHFITDEVLGVVSQAYGDSLRSAVNDGLFKNGKATPEFQRFIDSYNKHTPGEKIDPNAKADDILKNKAIQEYVAETTRELLGEPTIGRFSLPRDVSDAISDSLVNSFGNSIGKRQGMFDRTALPTIHKAIRDIAFDLRESPAPTDGKAAENPVSPKPSNPAAATPDAATVNRNARYQSLNIDPEAVVARREEAQREELAREQIRRGKRKMGEDTVNDVTKEAGEEFDRQLERYLAALEGEGIPHPVGSMNLKEALQLNELAPDNNLPKWRKWGVRSGQKPAEAPQPAGEAQSTPEGDKTPTPSTSAPLEAFPEGSTATKNETESISPVATATAEPLKKFGTSEALPEGLDAGASKIPETDQVNEAREKHQEGPIRQAIDTADANRGKVVWVKDYASAKKDSSGFAESERAGEIRRQSASKRKAGEEGTAQDKPFIPTEIRLNSKGEAYINGYDVDVMLSNLRHIVDFARDNGVELPLKNDAEIEQALNNYHWNHANGFDGAGTKALKKAGPNYRFPDASPDNGPRPLDADPVKAQRIADMLNMAVNAKAKDVGGGEGGKAVALNIKNQGFLQGVETNQLRKELTDAGFDVDANLSKRSAFYGRLAADLIKGGIQTSPDGLSGQSVRPHGFDIDLQKAFEHGKPQFEAVTAGFMPGEAGKPLSGFEEKTPSIKSKVRKTNPLGFFSGLRETAEILADEIASKSLPAVKGRTIPGRVIRDKEGNVIKEIPDRTEADKPAKTIDLKDQIIPKLLESGAKQEEMEVLGLPQFLEGKTNVTKQEILDFIDANQVELKEVQKGNKKRGIGDVDLNDVLNHHDLSEETWSDMSRSAQNEYIQSYLNDSEVKDDTKFSQYQLPGGENYKEVLWTLPPKSEVTTRKRFSLYENGELVSSGDETSANRWRSQGETDIRESNPVDHQLDKSGSFTSQHWDEPNVVAHVRQADHVDTEGSKVRLIEEMQSDWHQKGRKRGYKGDIAGLEAKVKEIEERYRVARKKIEELRIQANKSRDEQEFKAFWPEYSALDKEYGNAKVELEQASEGKVPDAPFKKSWHELAFKRALRQAVEDGMDKIAWTPGKEQIDRYEEALRQNVDEIHYEPFTAEDGSQKYELAAYKNGKEVFSEDEINIDQVGELVGKEIAAKIVKDEGAKMTNAPARDWRIFKGEDLAIGGEGMKGFYDKIIPEFVRKYVKPWGGKVETTNLANGRGMNFDRWVDNIYGNDRTGLTEADLSRLRKEYQETNPPKVDVVHSVTITPEMRKAVMSGQPMFMPGEAGKKGSLSDFGEEAKKHGSVYQGMGSNGLHAFKDESTGGNFSIKDGEVTPEKIASKAEALRKSFDVDQVTADNLDEFLRSQGAKFMPGNGEKVVTGKDREENFKKWTGDSPVYRIGDDLSDVTTGEPVVIEAVHGTTHAFDVADPSKTTPESNFGKGFYTSTSEADVSHNYAGEGPDLTSRIERRAEQIESNEEIPYEEAKQRARDELTTHGGATMKVFVKMENPLKLGKEERYWDSESDYNEATDEYGDQSGELPKFIEALKEAANEYDGSVDTKAEAKLSDLYYDGAKPSDAIDLAREAYAYFEDSNGDLVGPEIIRKAIESMGYDGIIDTNVSEKFKNMKGMDEGTAHVIAFKPEQIKSATGNIGTFDPKNLSMNFMPGEAGKPLARFSKDEPSIKSKVSKYPYSEPPRDVLEVDRRNDETKRDISEYFANDPIEADRFMDHFLKMNDEADAVVSLREAFEDWKKNAPKTIDVEGAPEDAPNLKALALSKYNPDAEASRKTVDLSEPDFIRRYEELNEKDELTDAERKEYMALGLRVKDEFGSYSDYLEQQAQSDPKTQELRDSFRGKFMPADVSEEVIERNGKEVKILRAPDGKFTPLAEFNVDDPSRTGDTSQPLSKFHEQSRKSEEGPASTQEDAEGSVSGSSFRVEPAAGGAEFRSAIEDTAKRHKLGAAVEVKAPEFYSDPNTRLFVSEDKKAGVAVTESRDLVSVFKHPESKADIKPILEEASKHAKTLDAFDVKGFLPTLYSKFGFKPVARVPFNKEYAPDGWPYDLAGEPDVVLMVRDPENNTDLPVGEYNAIRDKVPVFDDYDAALAEQQRQVDVAKAEVAFMPGSEEGDHVTINRDDIARFMPASDKVDLADYADRKIIALPADRMGIGRAMVGPDSNRREASIERQGGRGFMNIFNGGGWAFSDTATAGRFITRLRPEADANGDVIVGITVQSPINHLKNQTGQQAYVDAMNAAIDGKLITKRAADSQVKAMSDAIVASDAVSIKQGTRDKFASIRSFADLSRAIQRKQLNFADVSPLLTQMSRKKLPIDAETMDRSGISTDKLARDLADPELNDIPFGSVVALLKINTNQTPVRDEFHHSYPVSVHGEALGFLKDFYNVSDLSTDPRIKNKAGRVSAQPLQTVLPLLDNLQETLRKGGGIPSDPSLRTGSESHAQFMPGTPEEQAKSAAKRRIRWARSVEQLEGMVKDQEGFRNWYSEFSGYLRGFLGENADYAPLLSEFLNVTSAATTVESNVPIAVRALREFILTGNVSTTFKAHSGNLQRAIAGEKPSGPKISEYSAAVFGDENAIPVDRHVAQLLFKTDKPSTRQIAAAKDRVRQIAQRLGWTPRQVQASMWAANQALNGQVPTSYESHLEKHRNELTQLFSFDRAGEGRGIRSSEAIGRRISKGGSPSRDGGGSPPSAGGKLALEDFGK